MNRRYFLPLLSLSLLAACQSTPPAVTETPASPSHSSSVDPRAAQLKKDRAYAVNNPKADFPQLHKELAENEALVVLHTTHGSIRIKLFPQQAPLTVENFMTHAKNGYYNGLSFHRVIKDFMIQGGDPLGNGTGGESIWAGKDDSIDSGHGFTDEISAFLYNIRGSLSMANAGPGTNGSQFFINQNATDVRSNLSPQVYPEKIIQAYQAGGNPNLDGRHTVFGQVIEGMEVVDAIAGLETDAQDKPKEEVRIQSIEILKDFPTTP